MNQSRDGFVTMLVVGFLLGATVLFALTAAVVLEYVNTWRPVVAVGPIVVVAALVGCSRFWRPGGLNKSSGLLLGLAVGLAGAATTCI